ncbi:NDR1/HIN1-like protein 13 [Rosa sericea]
MHPGPYNPPPGAYPPPGPYGRNVPRYGHPGAGSRRGGCSCLKVYCCCCCCLFITLVLIIGGIVLAYFIINPQAPKFSIDKFEVKSFNISDDFSLKSHLEITAKADNPNKYIEITYGEGKEPKDNSVQVFYSNVTLCSGTIPNIFQPKKNVTMIKIDLKGDLKKEDWAAGSGESLASKLKNNDKIPLFVAIKAPVKVKLGSWWVTKDEPLVVSINATMNVKNLAEGKNPEISDKKYSIGLLFGKIYTKLS